MHRFCTTAVFRAAKVWLVITAICACKLSEGQRADPGSFTERLTFSAGASYSLQKENIPACAGLHVSPQLSLTTHYTDFSVSINP